MKKFDECIKTAESILAVFNTHSKAFLWISLSYQRISDSISPNDRETETKIVIYEKLAQVYSFLCNRLSESQKSETRNLEIITKNKINIAGLSFYKPLNTKELIENLAMITINNMGTPAAWHVIYLDNLLFVMDKFYLATLCLKNIVFIGCSSLQRPTIVVKNHALKVLLTNMFVNVNLKLEDSLILVKLVKSLDVLAFVKCSISSHAPISKNEEAIEKFVEFKEKKLKESINRMRQGETEEDREAQKLRY